MISFGVVVPVVPGGIGIERFVRVLRDDLASWNGEGDGLVGFGGDLEAMRNDRREMGFTQ